MRIWTATEYLGETQQRNLALLHILSHGLRAGEIVSLNVGAFDGKLIFVADTKTNEPRLVPLRKQSRDALKEYLSWRESQGEEITSDRSIFRTVATKFATLSLRYPSNESEQIYLRCLDLGRCSDVRSAR